jgi:hypothetical protein
MSNPPRREARPNSPYDAEPGARPRGGDARVPDDDSWAAARDRRRRDPGYGNGRVSGNSPTRGGDPWADAPTRRMPTQPGATQPSRMARDTGVMDGGVRDTGVQRGNREPREFRDNGGPRRLWLGGSLSGGLGVAIVAASTALGASATMLTGKEPGSILGGFVIVGTVAAAVAVRPRAGRMIIPVPALSYLVAAMVTGVIYDRSADVSKTALAINAAQWIASGFFAMALATILAVVLVTVRWILWRRQQPAAQAPGWSARPPANQDRPQPGLDDYWSPAPYETAYGPAGPGEPGPPPAAPGAEGPWGSRAVRPDQQRPPRTESRQARPPGPGPYNFSSGA